MKGHDREPIQSDEIRKAFRNPIGSKSIGQLARGRKEAVVIFDDLTRITRSAQIMPYIIEELNANGISKDHIRFICALGAHGACNRIDFVKKLGEDIVEQFPVYNHNPFSNLVELGKTARGTPVAINGEVMTCDLKIGVGTIVPHPEAGFSGGGKIILPGVASIDGLVHNHREIAGLKNGLNLEGLPASVGWGKIEGNIMRQDFEEAARMASLDIKVDGLVNGHGKITDVFVGDFVAEHRAAVQIGKDVYATQPVEDADIVVANTYAKVNEASLGVRSTVTKVKEGGTLVLVANALEGQVTHYLCGKFGKKSGGPLYSPFFAKFNRVIVFAPCRIRDPFLPIAEQESTIWTKDWKEVIQILENAHPGNPTVAVYPEAEIQIDDKAVS